MGQCLLDLVGCIIVDTPLSRFYHLLEHYLTVKIDPMPSGHACQLCELQNLLKFAKIQSHCSYILPDLLFVLLYRQ